METFREQRTDGTVDQAAGQRFLFSRAALPLEKAARNASGGRKFFLIMNGKGEKVLPFLHGFGGGDCAQHHGFAISGQHCAVRLAGNAARFGRSEEHTSELQSLMRTLYAVFCVKEKRAATRLNLQSQLDSWST